MNLSFIQLGYDYLCFFSSKSQGQRKGLYKWGGLHGLFGIWISLADVSGRHPFGPKVILSVSVKEPLRAALSVWAWLILNSEFEPSLNPCHGLVNGLQSPNSLSSPYSLNKIYHCALVLHVAPLFLTETVKWITCECLREKVMWKWMSQHILLSSRAVVMIWPYNLKATYKTNIFFFHLRASQ